MRFRTKKEGFILLHHFMKETQKTPPREILIAKTRLREAEEKEDTYEQ
ncbi:MAG: type II toxin-antitoxin system RelE/ParE family toxin [Clostridiales Family XIII bacterium]|nr:type II toxin-antitoxin system RelE/ParE family toxin [Clostridiales Family XIII bacterium]